MLDRLKQCCTFAPAIGWKRVASGNGDTLHRPKVFPPYKRAKRQSGKAANGNSKTTFFDKLHLCILRNTLYCSVFTANSV